MLDLNGLLNHGVLLVDIPLEPSLRYLHRPCDPRKWNLFEQQLVNLSSSFLANHLLGRICDKLPSTTAAQVTLFAIVNVPILDCLRSSTAWTGHSKNLSLLLGHYRHA